jgi:excisionase family DNA binding protein
MTLQNAAIEDPEARRHDAGGWRAASFCRKFPTRWWFGGDHRETIRAKDICAGCVVRTPCLEFALGRPELLGVWAATTPTERVAMRRAGVAASEIEIGVDVDGPANAEQEVEAGEEVDGEAVRLDLVLEAERHLGREALVRTPPAGERAGLGDRDALFTPAEAARQLGVTANTVTRWSRAGRISAIQTMGGHRRFRRSEVERVQGEANIVADAAIAI